MIYLTSDNHFYHTRIIKYSNRPFENVDEMNIKMIENWNSVVSKNDLVIHLGDFALAHFDISKNILENLNGHKIIIKGNHDRSIKWLLRLGFNRAYKSLSFENTKYGKLLFIHNPKKVSNDKENYYNFIIHGHIHEKKLSDFDYSEFKNIKKYINVSVEQFNYKPIKISEILKKFDRKDKNL